MISINNISMRYGQKLLFQSVKLELGVGRRYGVNGANGAGKSTLLRLLAGEEEAASGSFSYPKSKRLGFLKQDQFRYEQDRVIDVVLQGRPKLWQALEEKKSLLSKDLDSKGGLRLAELEHIILETDGYTAESIAEKILIGLGVAANYHHGPLSALSGGFKLRVLLAQILFSEPDIMLLDEPTNHLDIVSIKWLEEFLSEYRGVIIFVSHDRNFLNNVASDILDIDYDTITLYTGNFDKFLTAKIAALELRTKERAGQERQIAHLQKFIDRFGFKATKAKQAQARKKQIEKISVTEIPETNRRTPAFSFKQSRPSGKQALEVKGLSKSFANKVLDDVSFTVQRGEKLAVIGPNGVGKSTLLKILLEKHQADAGSFSWGHEVRIADFAQDHHEALHGKQSVWEWLAMECASADDATRRRALGRMLFSGDEVHQSIQALSGGEAARLLLARVILLEANVLILDEPTNHLDMEAISDLGRALNEFPGTLILVSHDRHFVSGVADRILAIKPQGLQDFQGTYQEYLVEHADYFNSEFAEQKTENKKKNKAETRAGTKAKKPRRRVDTGLEQRLESEIAELEAKLAALDVSLAEAGADYKSLAAERQTLSAALEGKLLAWEAAAQENHDL